MIRLFLNSSFECLDEYYSFQDFLIFSQINLPWQLISPHTMETYPVYDFELIRFYFLNVFYLNGFAHPYFVNAK